MTPEDVKRIAQEVYEAAGMDKFSIDLMIERIALRAVEEARKLIEARVMKSDLRLADKLYVVNEILRARGQR